MQKSKKLKYNKVLSDRIYNLMDMNKYSQAIREINSYLEQYPKDYMMMINLGKCFFRLGNMEAAEEISHYVIENETTEKAKAYILLAKIEMQRGNIEATKNYYELSASCGYVVAKNMLAMVNINEGKIKEASNIINSIKIEDYSYSTYIIKATILCYLGNIKKAKEIIDTINPEDIYENDYKLFINTKVRILLEMDEYNNAITILKDYVNNYALTMDFNCILLIKYYIDGKKYNEAFDMIYNVKNSHDEFLTMYAKYYEIKIFENVGEMKKAKSELLTLVDNLKNKPFCNEILYKSYISLGKIELVNKNYNKAKEYFLELNENDYKSRIKKIIYLAVVAFRQDNLEKVEELIASIHDIPLVIKEKQIYDKLNSIINKKNNKLVTPNNYFECQLLNYSNNRLVNHINKIHRSCECNSEFNNNINLYELVYKVKTLINKDNLIESDVIEKYIVHYNNIGRVNGVNTDYMEVITFKGAEKIITMYPIINVNKADLNLKNGSKSKQKTMSRIDKFNKRYGNNN